LQTKTTKIDTIFSRWKNDLLGKDIFQKRKKRNAFMEKSYSRDL